ncbi:lipocalin-like domain-containing protein [soil metagenome]
MRRRDALTAALAWAATGDAVLAQHVPAVAVAQATKPAKAPRIEPRPLHFPADFGSHPEHQTEWWYLTGWVQVAGAPGATPRTFGFQVTFFRSRTGFDAPGSRFSPQQLVFAHTALSDLSAGRQRHDQRIARSGFGVSASTTDTDVALRDWSLVRTGPVDASGYRAKVRSASGGFGFDFELAGTQPTLLQGKSGFSQKGPDPTQASHYYSHPQLALTGALTLDGQRLTVVGKGWLDHEWSDAVMAPDAVGWDWIGMNLDDGSALTAFQLRRADGSALYAGGSWRGPSGALRNFSAADVRFTAGRQWKSPASGASYPVAWTIDTPEGNFSVTALLDAQEQDSRASTGAFYWEGLSELRRSSTGGDSTKVGRGYLEMTGYVQRLRL